MFRHMLWMPDWSRFYYTRKSSWEAEIKSLKQSKPEKQIKALRSNMRFTKLLQIQKTLTDIAVLTYSMG